MGIESLRRWFYRVALLNLLQFLYMTSYVYPLFDDSNSQFQKYVFGLVGLLILGLDLFVTLAMIREVWNYDPSGFTSIPVLYMYGITSATARLFSVLYFVGYSSMLELTILIVGVSSVGFGLLLLSVHQSSIGKVHDHLLQLLILANLAGVGVFINATTITAFLSIKTFLPLLSSFIFFVIGSDIYLLENGGQ